METITKKITLATFKSFVKKNEGKLYIRVKSSFDGMTDCVESVKDEFSLIKDREASHSNTLGISGVWLVGNSRDYFSLYEDETYKGFHVSNCCGSFDLVVIK